MKRLLLALPFVALFCTSVLAADNIDTLIRQSRSAEQAGNIPDAILYIQSALVADPGRAATYAALGDFYVRANQSDLAMQYYDQALDLNPTEPTAKRGMALIARSERTGKSAALDNN